MKKAGIVLLIFMTAICMMTNDAWAGAQVYFTISIGGGLFIGVIGVCIQAVFQQRIAQEQEGLKPLAAQLSEPKPSVRNSFQQPLRKADPVLALLDPPEDTERAVHPDFKVNFFTFRW